MKHRLRKKRGGDVVRSAFARCVFSDESKLDVEHARHQLDETDRSYLLFFSVVLVEIHSLLAEVVRSIPDAEDKS